MANYLKKAIEALFGNDDNDNNKEELKKAEEAEKAGNEAAERGAKNAGFVPKVNVNEAKAATEAKKPEKTIEEGKDR